MKHILGLGVGIAMIAGAFVVLNQAGMLSVKGDLMDAMESPVFAFGNKPGKVPPNMNPVQKAEIWASAQDGATVTMTFDPKQNEKCSNYEDGATCSGNAEIGTNVRLTTWRIDDEGSRPFRRWEGENCPCSESPECGFTVTQQQAATMKGGRSVTCAAVYKNAITIKVSNNTSREGQREKDHGVGIITGGGFSCEDGPTGLGIGVCEQQKSMNRETPISFTAAAKPGFEFVEWDAGAATTDRCDCEDPKSPTCTFNIPFHDVSCIAWYKNSRKVDVVVTTAKAKGYVTATFGDKRATCSGEKTCYEYLPVQTVVGLTAVPGPSEVFSSWEDLRGNYCPCKETDRNKPGCTFGVRKLEGLRSYECLAIFLEIKTTSTSSPSEPSSATDMPPMPQ